MPREATAEQLSTLETIQTMLLSQAAKLFTEKKLENAIVFILPDTGKCQFKPQREYVKKKGKNGEPDEMATAKATFVVAELGTRYEGETIGLVQSNGPVADLPLSVTINVIAQPPNTKGTTIEEALTDPKAAKAAETKAA